MKKLFIFFWSWKMGKPFSTLATLGLLKILLILFNTLFWVSSFNMIALSCSSTLFQKSIFCPKFHFKKHRVTYGDVIYFFVTINKKLLRKSVNEKVFNEKQFFVNEKLLRKSRWHRLYWLGWVAFQGIWTKIELLNRMEYSGLGFYDYYINNWIAFYAIFKCIKALLLRR